MHLEGWKWSDIKNLIILKKMVNVVIVQRWHLRRKSVKYLKSLHFKQVRHAGEMERINKWSADWQRWQYMNSVTDWLVVQWVWYWLGQAVVEKGHKMNSFLLLLVMCWITVICCSPDQKMVYDIWISTQHLETNWKLLQKNIVIGLEMLDVFWKSNGVQLFLKQHVTCSNCNVHQSVWQSSC